MSREILFFFLSSIAFLTQFLFIKNIKIQKSNFEYDSFETITDTLLRNGKMVNKIFYLGWFIRL